MERLRIYYNSDSGYRRYIGFWKDSKNKIHFTIKGLSFYKNI